MPSPFRGSWLRPFLHPRPVAVGLPSRGYKGDTSQAQQTLAALKAFGLLEYKGSGPKRSVMISDFARTFLRANQESLKESVLKDIALTPKWIARMWGQWGVDRHPDEVCLDELVLQHKFTENAAALFLRVYDETIAYAGLADSDKIDPKIEGHPDVEDGDDGNDDHTPPPPPPPAKEKGAVLEMGERELTTGLLSKEAGFRLIVHGKIGPKEIERLIAKLELDKEILADSNDNQSPSAEVDAQ